MTVQLNRKAPSASDEEALHAALAGGFAGLRQLPADVEAAYRSHCHGRASVLLRRSIYGLAGLYLLVVVPIFVFSNDPTMPMWEMYAMAPIGVVLAALWLSTRVAALDDYTEVIIGASLFTCLAGTLYCSMRLDGQYFGQMAAYETIYILIVALTILQLSPRVALPSALMAFAVSLLSALASGLRPSWLEMLLYFVVPLLICMVTGYILDHSERRNFVQHLLLNRESQRLAQLHASAEENIRQQQFTTEFLTLISGNLSLKELFSRTLGFLVEHTGAQVGAGYHLSTRGRLRRVGSWAIPAEALQDARKEVEPGDTLMGPALQHGQVMHLQNVRADYLPIECGVGILPCAAVLVLPIVQAGRPLAVIELGKITPFGADELHYADMIRTHLAYAVTAANAREIALKAPAA